MEILINEELWSGGRSELAREVSMDSEPIGVSEVMKGGGRSSEQLGKGGKRWLLPAPPTPTAPSTSWALGHTKWWFRNHFQTQRPEKQGCVGWRIKNV